MPSDLEFNTYMNNKNNRQKANSSSMNTAGGANSGSSKAVKYAASSDTKLNAALSQLAKTLSADLPSYSTEKIEEYAKKIKYCISGTLGCNYYIQSYKKDNLKKMSKKQIDSLTTTITCRSTARFSNGYSVKTYQDMEFDGTPVTYYEQGFQLYKQYLDSINEAKESLNREIDRILGEYDMMKKELMKASSKLEKIKISGFRMNSQYEEYIKMLDSIVSSLNSIKNKANNTKEGM